MNSSENRSVKRYADSRKGRSSERLRRSVSSEGLGNSERLRNSGNSGRSGSSERPRGSGRPGNSERPTGSAKRGVKRSLKLKRLIMIFLLGAIMCLFCIFLGLRIISDQKKLRNNEERKARLEQMIEEEKERSSELENEQDYVKTKEYIEEKARSIGYIYPDEIIFKEEE